MSYNTTISFNWDKSDLAKLERMQKKIPLLFHDDRLKKNIAMLLSAQGKTNIDEQSPDGQSDYLDLSDKYKSFKGFDKKLIGRKQGKGKKGIEAGLLRKSIDWEMGSRDTIYLTTISYGKYHQFGGDKIPARPIFTIRADNKVDIMNFIKQTYKQLLVN
jgi:phage gpG-like protein